MKINQLKAGAILSYASMGLGYIISIVYTPIMLRLLGQSEYGLYNLVSSVVSYLGLLSFGFGSAYMRYYSRYKVNKDEENIAKLNGMFLIVFSTIGFIAILAGIVLVLNIDLIFGKKLTTSELNTAKILMAIMVFNIALSFPASVFSSHITANEKYVFQKLLQMIKTLINPMVMLPVLLMGYKSIGMVVVTTSFNIIIEISNTVFCLRKLKMNFIFNKFNFYLMKEIIIFSSYIFLNMIIDQINWSVDKFVLGRFRGTVAVAVYGLASQLNTYYLSLSTAISNVFIPRVNRMVVASNDNRELTNLFTRVGRVQFILLSLICSVLIFFGQPFINMWAGSDYSEAYSIALLLIIPVTIPLIQNLGIEIQKAKNMHKFRSWIYLFIAIGNMFLSIPLTKSYGGVGAALGTAISLIIGNGIIMNVYYHKKVELDMRYFWSKILSFIPALLLPVIVGIIMVLFVDMNHILVLLMCGIIYVVVFSISMWFIGMNQYEKDLVGKPISKLIKKVKLNTGKCYE
ncbi:O-antigen/teichoic acid export membrane protein [Clostridium pascui]|uniref:oligosaccharide flippase family protein n=1 Tax=Clostridium pascui TaxID=46609 RepID=UPI0019564F39|nr:oligosaccharide flippase family protein [Clostridium pascui]MBM7869849.1 O-antigen/teichoic acid export membrane protein [Clostridium pascui]